MGEVDIIPVLEGEIGSLKDQPDEDRPGNHQEKLSGPTEEEGVSLETIDKRINGEDIGPPRKAIEPTVERIDFFEEEDFRDKKESNSNDPMNGKNLSHGGLI
jgi:hypothetical protein